MQPIGKRLTDFVDRVVISYLDVQSRGSYSRWSDFMSIFHESLSPIDI